MKGRKRERDDRVILHVGYHRQLTRDQIGLLEFPYHGKKDLPYSYNTCQRRIREFYIPNKLLSEPTYIALTGKYSNQPIYTLSSEGKALYSLLTGLKPKTNLVSLKYTPHLIETNNLLIYLKRTGWLGIGDFDLEYKLGSIMIDVLISVGNSKIAIEIDLSEKDWKKEIQRQFKGYEKAVEAHIAPKQIKGMVYYSNRCKVLQKWITEASRGYITPSFTPRNPKYALQAIKDILDKEKATQ